MGARFLTPQEFTQLLALPFPFADRVTPLPISDIDPDPGLFGPGSMTWEVLREPLLILAGARALLMQAAHPHVAQGAIDHSAFAEDPFGRLVRTFEWAGSVVFGTTTEARAVSARVNRMHHRVSGTLPRGNGTRAARGGSGYSAMDEALLLWVHATFVDTLLVAHDRMVGGLTRDDRDQFVHEWEAVGRLMGVPDRLFWADHAALRQYVDEETHRGAARPGAGSRLVARTVLHPPLPTPVLRPFMDALSFMSVGFLPPELRQGYEIPWNRAHDLAHGSITRMLRTSRGRLPRRLRYAPIYDFAMARSSGRLLARFGRTPRHAA
ncbi:MAG TPA: oxygenase MpaB family protein [Candidatus Dormibacteraeota bacterium]|nr:oxygenase MpaB family protein [Candidatus Dormibacteraeota bacterium]